MVLDCSKSEEEEEEEGGPKAEVWFLNGLGFNYFFTPYKPLLFACACACGSTFRAAIAKMQIYFYQDLYKKK